jgi:NAD(P)-dependent dehydrogenase (short-subunit alcohol dehydrogenase family)
MTPVCVVTGANGGIGSAIAERFTRDGYLVEAADVETGCDVTNEHDVDVLFDRAAARGDVTAVVLAHGIAARGRIEETPPSEWERVMAVNATGSFLCARAAVRVMPRGSIVFLSSQAGRKGAAGWGAYAASKFAVIGLMESLAQEQAPRCIRANAICPGSIETSMLRTTADDPDQLCAVIPIGRFGEPAEVAALAAFLCSDEAAYMSGASLVIDGAELS